MKNKIYSIQILRGVAALLVVLYHILMTEDKFSGSNKLLPDFFEIGKTGVDLFFVISGFILAVITYDTWGSGNSFKFILKRFSRIYPTYWFYLLIALSVYLVQPRLVYSSQHSEFNFFTSLFLIPNKKPPLILAAWTLVYEVYFYVLFSVVISFKKKYVIVAFSLWLFLLVGSNLFFSIDRSDYFLYFITHPYQIEFILGVFCAVLYKSHKIKFPNILYSLLCLISLCLIPYFYYTVYKQILPQSLIFGLLYSTIVFTLVSIERKSNLQYPKIFITIGDSSYSMYLSNMMILNALGRLWNNFMNHPDSLFDNWVLLFISIVAITIWSYLSARFIERPSYNYLTSKVDRIFKTA